MINVKNKIERCHTRSIYGWLSKGTSFCSTHRKKGMITSPNRKCESACCKLLGRHELNSVRYCKDHMPQDAENLGIEKWLG